MELNARAGASLPFTARLVEVRRSLPDVYWIVWLGTLINRLGGFVFPILTFYLIGQRGLSVAAAGFVVSGFGAGAVLAALAGGVLADRFGRRSTMLLSLVTGAVLMGALGLQRSLPAIALNTFLLGAAGELYRPAVMAFVGDVVPAEQRPRAYGYLYWVINLAFAFAALVGGLLSRWSYTALFAADAATMLIYAGVVALWLPETGEARTGSAAAPPSGLRHVFQDRTFMTFWALSFGLLLLLYQSAVPLAAHLAGQGWSPSAYGALIALNGVLIVLVQPLVTARVTSRDRSRALAGAAVLFGVGFALHGLSSWLVIQILAIATWTLGELIASPLHSAIVADLAGATSRGRYQGTFGMAWGLASMVGPALGAAILERAGAGVLWLGCLALGGCVALGYLASADGRRERGT